MNNEVLNAIKTRRSIRKYKAEQITDEQLDAILEAGTYAATGMGKQSPVIVVVQKPELIAKLSKMNAAVMGTTSDPFYGAPTVLIVLADPERGTYVEDGSLVMGNLMLAAHAVGVDSCWIHRAKEEFASPEGKADEGQLHRDGQGRGDALGNGVASSTIGAHVAMDQIAHIAHVAHGPGVVQTILLMVLGNRLGRGTVTQRRVGGVGLGERHKEEHQDGDAQCHDRQRHKTPSNQT